MPDDSELLRHYARDRSEDAFSELVRRHLPFVHSVAKLRLGGDSNLADDVAQHVFIALARQARSLVSRPSLAGWLYSTTRFKAIDLVRSEHRRKIREVQAMSEAQSNPSVLVDWSQLEPVLARTLDQLGESDREVLLMRFFENKTYDEIANAIGMTQNAARKRVERSLERMKPVLGKHGVTSTVGVLAELLANQPAWAAPTSLATTITQGALAATATHAAILPATLSLLMTTKTASFVTGLVLAFAVGMATRDVLVARQTRSDLVGAKLAYESGHSQLTGLIQRQAGLQFHEDLLKQRFRSGPSSSGSTQSAESAIENGRRLLASNPNLRQAFQSLEKAKTAVAMRRNFGTTLLDLTSAQEERLATLLEKPAKETFTAYGMPYTFQTDDTASSREIDENDLIEAVGGQTNLEKFKRSTDGSWLSASGLAAAAADSATPLTPQQFELMMTVFKESGTKGGMDWSQATSKASAVLNPAQMAALEGLHAQTDFYEAWHSVP